ncbi:MAG: glycosyltransferase family 4 protein [Deferribacteres bacterium]|nr:glycosyltransferase family 4 protein [Deferribacteres bacterium]
MEKYNILYTSCFASLRRGGQKSLHLLLKHLDKKRFTPFLIVPHAGELSEEAGRSGVKVFILPFPAIRVFNLFRIISRLVSLYGLIRKEGIDLIHTESPRETFYAGVAGKISRIPVVLHLRVSDSSHWLDRILCRLADCMIAVSRSAARRFETIGAMDRVRIVYNGVDTDVFRPPDSNGSDTGLLRVGYFGRIERRKGIEVLVRAAGRLAGRVKLVIMGEGDGRYLDELKESAAGADVIFKDYKGDIREDIAGVDAVVLPSLKEEGLPRIMIESMAMGKIVVASDLLSTREALGGGLEEFLFPPGDHMRLASILGKLAENRQVIHEMKGKLRGRAESVFDIRRNTRQIERIYDSLRLGGRVQGAGEG